jgi:flagellar assembly protein FliH
MTPLPSRDREAAFRAPGTSSRVLRPEELTEVTAILWRTTTPAPSRPAAKPVVEPKILANEPKTHTNDVDREAREREAYQRGMAEGVAIGKTQAAAEIQPVMERLGKSIADLSNLRPRIRRDAEKDLLKLSIAIARRVLHRELTIDPESIEGLIKVALDKLQSRELWRVRMHPEQEAPIRASLERFANSQKAELVADASLQIGDVLFETPHGTIDASIESQLREIERGFADRLKR